jgi:hypothetical protein
MHTPDAARVEMSKVFLISELERLDNSINMPLESETWSRDMPLNTEVTISDEISSFTRSWYTANGQQDPNGMNWIASGSTQLAGTETSIDKITNPLNVWGIEVKYNLIDLEKSMAVGRNISSEKSVAVNRKYQKDADRLVYIGDEKMGYKGLLNLNGIPISSASTKTGGGTAWSITTKVEEILDDINALIYATLQTTNETIAPSRILMPWSKYNAITTRQSGEGADFSPLKFLLENNISNQNTGKKLEIFPCKWCDGAGVGSKDRMIAYTPDKQYIRTPILPLHRTPLEQRSLWLQFTYYTVMGGVENVYPETVGYMDGI